MISRVLLTTCKQHDRILIANGNETRQTVKCQMNADRDSSKNNVSTFLALIKIVVLLCSALTTLPVHSQEGLGISKGAFAYLLDISGNEDPHHLAFIPAGTWLEFKQSNRFPRFFPDNENKLSEKFILIKTENGITGYIEKDNIWDPKALRRELEDESGNLIYKKLAIFFRTSEEIKITKNIRLWFTAGEKYPVSLDSGQGSKGLTIKVNIGAKLVGEDQIKNVVINDENKVLKTFSADVLDGKYKPEFADEYELIPTITKNCNSKTFYEKLYKYNIGGKVIVDTPLSIAQVKANVGKSISNTVIEEMVYEANVLVTIQDFKRNNVKYRTVQKSTCSNESERNVHAETSNNVYINLIPGPKDQKSKAGEKYVKLTINNTLQKIMVTCPSQYFKFRDFLDEYGLHDGESSQIISYTAQFASYDQLKKNMSIPKCDS